MLKLKKKAGKYRKNNIIVPKTDGKWAKQKMVRYNP